VIFKESLQESHSILKDGGYVDVRDVAGAMVKLMERN